MHKHIALILFAFFCCAAASLAKNPAQPESYAYTRGVEAYNENKYADALEWFGKELAEHPDNGYAYVYISTIRYGYEEFGKALTAIDNAIKRLPKKDKEWRSLAFSSRADVYAALGDTAKAMDDLAQAIQIDPENTKFYSNRAQLNYELDNFDLSDADYQKMTTIDQGDVVGYMGIGRNANARQRWDDAIAQFDRVVKLAPDYSSGFSFRAEAYIGKEKWAEATDDLIKALDIDGDKKAMYMIQSLPPEASAMLKAKLKIQMTKQPSNVFWPYYLAMVAEADKDYAEAIKYYEQANKIDANSIFNEYASKCYFCLDDMANALEYADRALAMSPDDYDVIDLKADILSGMGRFDECLALRDKYVEKFPENPRAYAYRAEDLMNARRYGDAAEDYSTVAVLSQPLSEVPYILMKRGDALRLSGQPEKAYQYYELLLKQEADSVLSAKSCTPFAYSALGDAEKTVESMQFILDTDTLNAERALYNAACVYARLGKYDEAVAFLKEAVAKGYKKFSHIQADYDLDGLRDLPGFREFIEQNMAVTANDTQPQDESAEFLTEVVEIPFTKEGGVTKVKCNINGLPLHFVFDTGAADVTMSMVEANFMLKNDYISPSDIIGSARYIDANGDISEGTVINLRNVNFGGLELDNVRASVVRNQKAPLLLGQSVLGRLGKIEIDNTGMKLVITHKVARQ